MNDPSPLEAIFFAALEKGSPQERAAYLDEACVSDPDLRRRVEKMLDAQARAGSFLEQAALSPVPTADEQPVSECPGTVIGPYKLLAQIGEGGFGVVFLADQAHPVRRKVALKVLKPGMDTRQVVARFEAERQALAIMDHPHIAKVHDGGTTPSGRPYFVMELVKGVPITDFCDQGHLTPRQRLALFVTVCQAVQHAHHKGIIHRDLKPSNVLVTVHDTTPVVKVIDFGVAKALGQELTDKTLFTGLAQMVGTPLYMSPEQAGQSGLDIDTRSDIYSLGVLLYELLTGATPFDKERFRQATYDEIRRIIRDEDPPTPSTRLSESEDSLPSISAKRQTEPAKLTKLVRGELDWIVMKALEKDRNRRYETANDLALDVRRYLQDEPVQACLPSVGYRLRKFVRRHRGPVIAAGLVLLALVAGIVSTSFGLIRADQQRRIAEGARADEAHHRALAIAERNAADKARNRTREALDAMTSAVTGNSLMTQSEISPEQKAFLTEVLTYYREFAGEKADDELSRKKAAAAAYRVGFIGFRLGRTEEAMAAFGKARDGYASLAGEFPAVPVYPQELARSHNNLGILLNKLGKLGEAEAHYRTALGLQERLAGQLPGAPACRQELARSHNALGILLAGRWKQAEAEEQYRRGLALQQELVAEFPAEPAYRKDLARSHNRLGVLLNEIGKHAEAEAQYHGALALGQRLVAEFPDVPAHAQGLAASHNGLGTLLNGLRKHAEAEAEHRKALRLRQKLAAEFPAVPAYAHELARSHDNLGVVLNLLARREEAVNQYRKALALRQKLAAEFPAVPAYRQDLGSSHHNLAVVLSALGERAEAEGHYRQGLALQESLVAEFPAVPGYRQDLGCGHLNLGNLLQQLAKRAEAEGHYRQGLALQESLAAEFPAVPAYRKELARGHKCLGILLQDLGKRAEAEEQFGKASALQEKLATEFPDLFDAPREPEKNKDDRSGR